MKKFVLFSIVLLFITAGTARAGRFLDYGSAQLALSDIDGFDSGIALILSAGKKIDQLVKGFSTEGLSVEGELSKSILHPEIGKNEADYFTLGGYGAGTHNFNQKFSVKARAGLVITSCSGCGSNTDIALGISGLYKLNDKFQIITEYTVIDDLTHLSAGVSMPLNF